MRIVPLRRLVALGALGAAFFAAATPLRAQANNSTLSVTFGGFTTPTGADFAAGSISGTISYTIVCGKHPRCLLTLAATNASVTEPAGTTATTNLQYSLDNGTTWTTLPTTPVTINPGAPTGTTTGSLLVRYRLGWQSGSNPYTPPGAYSLPIKFILTQGT